MKWLVSRINSRWLDSADGRYRITPANGPGVILISHIHEDKDGEPTVWRFRKLEEAKAHAETI